MTSPLFVRPGESLQRTQTIYRKFTDQHGRVFAAQCDIRNGPPEKDRRPAKPAPTHNFSPPWLPPMRFAKMVTGSDQFRWDYSTMASELAGQTAEVYSDYRKFAMREKLPIPEVGGVVDSLIRDALGEPPLSPAIPMACEQGDPWILGKPGAAVNPYLKEILEQGVGSSSKEALAYIGKRLSETAIQMAVPRIPTAPVAETAAEKPKSIDDLPNLEDMPEITYKDFLRS